MMDFTVAIPTYNGAKRLPRVLDKLQLQVNTEEIKWEIIVIDNNSSDDTFKVIQSYQNSWGKPYLLKYYFEQQQGLSFARQKAIQEALGVLVAFIDDDNLPTNDWVINAYLFGKKYPRAGAYSGQIHGEFEFTPPESFKPIYEFLAIREGGTEAQLFDPSKLQLPPGAGLVVRKQAWDESVPLRLVLNGRVGGKMVSGEDYEVLLNLHQKGWEIWYNPDMHLYHYIPKARLERDYLIPLCAGCGISTCYLRTVTAKTWEIPMLIAIIMIGGSLRVLKHLIKYKGKVKTDLVAACELVFFINITLSPIFYFQLLWSNWFNHYQSNLSAGKI